MCGFIKSNYLFFNIKSFFLISEFVKNSLILSIFHKFDEIAPSFVVIFPKLMQYLLYFHLFFLN